MCTPQPGQMCLCCKQPLPCGSGITLREWPQCGSVSPTENGNGNCNYASGICWDSPMSLHSSTSERVTGVMVEVASLEPAGLPAESTLTLVLSSCEPEKQMTRRSRLRRSSRPSGLPILAQTCSAFRPFSGSMRSLRETSCLWERR